MSYESRQTIDVSNERETQAFTSYQRNTYFGATVRQTSAVTVDIPKLQIDLQQQHHREKVELNDLNQRFQLFIDRIQSLQNQNAKYLIAIAELRGKFSGINTVQIEEDYVSYRSNYSSIASARIDHEWDLQLYQLQIGIYQRLIEIEQQSKDARIPSLEDELKKLVSSLVSIRSSYEQTQRTVEHLQEENRRLLQQYLVLTNEWCSIRKQRKKWELGMETLRSYVGFYKNIRANLVVESKSLTMATDDQFWRLELDRIIKRIRHDFETFYAEVYQQWGGYFQAKIEEAEVNLKQAWDYDRVEIEKFTVVTQQLHVEYEKVQTTLTYEREVYGKLEHTFNKLEAERHAIESETEERSVVQVNELQSVHENMVALAYGVEEMRRRKGDLELEIIIYRQLLSAAGIETQTQTTTTTTTAVIPRVEQVVHEQSGKLVIKRQKRGPVGIKDCAPNGAYIGLINSSGSRTIDLSGWSLLREVDKRLRLPYKIPDGVLLEPGRELRIYARRTSTATLDSGTYRRLVNNNADSWGEGTSTETFLFNQNGDEEASYIQSVAVQRI